MTDKQIIIDEIDVSGCEYYYKINKHTGQYCICELEPNCLYKQVKRKEQECEELKKENYELTEEVSIDRALFAEIDQLKAEVKSKTEYIQEQRDIINQYSKEIEMYKKCQGKRASKREEELKAENEIYKKMLEDEGVQLALTEIRSGERHIWYNKANKLSKTLTEIKEIAERDKEFCIKCNGDKEIDCVDCIEGGRALLAKDILQKISEVENE